jgi:DNA-binding NarL/FixJ family response regulator
MTKNEKPSKIRVLVADDNKLMREKIVQLMQPDFVVVGTASDGNTALEMALLLKPDIVVLDISMGAVSGLDVAAEVRKKLPPAKIVMLTVHEDPDYVKAAFDAGASSYVIKSEMATDLTDALRAVSEGNIFISPTCALGDD